MLLCLSFVRNYAFYQAAWNEDKTKSIGGSSAFNGTNYLPDQYWNTTVGNHIDIATLEWCKLFGNYKQEKFHWQKVVKDQKQYKLQLLKVFPKGEAEWSDYHEKILKYRNEFVAHLDEGNRIYIPYFETAHELVVNHYEYLVKNEVEDGIFTEPIPNIREYDIRHNELARKIYSENR